MIPHAPDAKTRAVPDLAQIRVALGKRGNAGIALDRLELSHIKLSGKGPVLFLFEGPLNDGQTLFMSARRVEPSKGLRLEDEANARPRGESDRLGSDVFRTPAFYDTELRLFFQVFPVDRRLPSLALAADPDRVAPALQSALAPDVSSARVRHVAVTTMRYKPERKCTFRYTVAWKSAAVAPSVVYGKVVREATFSKTHQILGRIRAAMSEPGLTLPEPLSTVPELCLEIFSEVPGVPLTTLCAVDGFDRHCARAAVALHEFHNLPVGLDLRWDATAKVERLTEVTAGLTLLVPERAAIVRSLSDELGVRLHAQAVPRPGLIHRDFHGTNVLVDRDRIGVIDLEDCALGDPAEDLGTMYAYLGLHALMQPTRGAAIRHARDEFINTYPGATALHDRIVTHAAMYCFLQAFQRLRRPNEPNYYEHAGAMLAECGANLDQGLTQ